jgi:hypothetical protein
MSVYLESARAGKASRIRKGFAIHLAAYLLVNALLVGINLATNPDRLWCKWPLLGWGVGILAHGIATYACAVRTARR